MRDELSIIGREKYLFDADLLRHETILSTLVTDSKFLILGGAGSIGQAVTKEIFRRNPTKLHVVDLSENNLVELVRDLRSTSGYITGDFKTFALDIGSDEYDAFINADGKYDFVLNLSALKHVRSEKDPFTLMRLIKVNILNTEKTIKQSIESGVKKYFCVSTDKAANPVNMMGASKRIMELFLAHYGKSIDISTARFANVTFSDGSLLYGFQQRLLKSQPIVAPTDVRRYFVTPKEAGELCLLSCLLGENNEIFFPVLDEATHLSTFQEVATRFLATKSYTPLICIDENEARSMASSGAPAGKWPCLFVTSNTTGEKDYEEFYVDGEPLNFERFESIGIVKNRLNVDYEILSSFTQKINVYLEDGVWTKKDLLSLFYSILPDFRHKDTGAYLDEKM